MPILPKEYVDVFVSFASLETPWSEWRRWFAMNAAKLCRIMDREEFRLIRANPKEEVPRFLIANNIAFSCADPFYTESPPTGEVSETEYAIYTSLFNTDLFVFDHGNTAISDHTGIVGIDRPSFCLERVEQAFNPTDDCHDLFRSFCIQNGHEYLLRPEFHVPSGYVLGDSSTDLESFVISRAGFDKRETKAVVYIGYFGGPTCGAGYLVGFRKHLDLWEQTGAACLWIS